MFGGQLTVEEIRLKIWDFILRNRNTYQNVWREKFRNSYSKYEKNRVLRTNLEIIDFSGLMRLNISIYLTWSTRARD